MYWIKKKGCGSQAISCRSKIKRMKPGLTICIVFSFLISSLAQTTPCIKLFIGTYTNTGKSEGIYCYAFNAQTAATTLLSKTVTESPSYLTISKNQGFLYSVNQLGEKKGGISAFKLSAGSDILTFLNRVKFGSNGPCYITTDNEGRFVFTANYNDGYLKVFPIQKDGSLDSNGQLVQHYGKSIYPLRQDSPHVHSTVLSPGDQYLLVQDLGTDFIKVYPVDLSKKSSPIGTVIDSCKLQPGSGPRHLVFHPTKKDKVYVIQELTGMITVLSFAKGKLHIEQSVHIEPEDFKGTNAAADIHISPDGKYLYGSNRGDANDLVIFAIDNAGFLTYKGRQPVLGKGPRNFTIDPTGNFLLVANQQSDEVVIFKRDTKTGQLADTGKRISVGAPVCLQMIITK